MAEQAWFSADESVSGSAEQFPAYVPAPPPPPPVAAQAAYELRPLTTGEILDRTFYLYRSNFWLFVGLASITAAVSALAGLAKIIYLHVAVAGNVTFQNLPASGAAAGVAFQIVTVVSGIISFAIYGVTQAATTSAVVSIYLGDATSMKQAFREVSGRWFRFTLIALWQIWSAMWVFLLAFVPFVVATVLKTTNSLNSGLFVFLMFVFVAGGMVYGVIAYIRNSFAVPAAVMEGLKVRKAIRRSKDLTSGTKGRVFLLFLFLFVLYMVVGALQAPVAFLILQKKTGEQFVLQALNLTIGFFAGSVLGPVGAIGLCLFYIDQRIRKEGFDIEFLIERSGPAPEPLAIGLPVDVATEAPVVAPHAPELP